jgi:mannose PTS system EIIA component
MVGILIIAHGTLGETLIQCATHVLGQRPGRIASVIVAGRGDPEMLSGQVKRLVTELDEGSGVLILTDMLGGTPSNIATRAILPGKVEGVSGVNLPMLIRALTYRSQPLAKVVAKALSGGQDGVSQIE